MPSFHYAIAPFHFSPNWSFPIVWTSDFQDWHEDTPNYPILPGEDLQLLNFLSEQVSFKELEFKNSYI